MIVIMKPGAKEEEVSVVINVLKDRGMQIQHNHGVDCVVLGVIGDTTQVDQDKISMLTGVDKIMVVSEPYKKANRKFHPDDTVVTAGSFQVGGKQLALIAGPCSVESQEQICDIAKAVGASGATALRGGAFKPRTSPYAFQGLEKEGIELLKQAREVSGLPIVTEIISPRQVEMFDMVVDVIQIGARNMQNFDLLKEVGKTRKPILLKRGLSSTLEEWLMSAEYILSRGNENVILCERGIRTFETYTRNTLDLSAVPAMKKLTHLPIVVDPSHGTGKKFMIEPMSLAAIAAGADGLIIEVHNDPVHALSDGPQSIKPDQFGALCVKLRAMANLVGRTL